MLREARNPLVDAVFDLVHAQLIVSVGPHLILLGREEAGLGGCPDRPPLVDSLAGPLEEVVSGSKKARENQVLSHNLFSHKNMRLYISMIDVHSKVKIKLSWFAVNRVKCCPVYTIKSYKINALRHDHKKECQCHKTKYNFTR